MCNHRGSKPRISIDSRGFVSANPEFVGNCLTCRRWGRYLGGRLQLAQINITLPFVLLPFKIWENRDKRVQPIRTTEYNPQRAPIFNVMLTNVEVLLLIARHDMKF